MIRNLIRYAVILAALWLPVQANSWTAYYYCLPLPDDPLDSTANVLMRYGDTDLRLYMQVDTWDEVVDSIEFFVDTDPGTGRATRLYDDYGYLDTTLDLGLLEPGLHTFNVRAHDLFEWNGPFTKYIYVMPNEQAATPYDLDSAEYFLDANTLPGAGTPFVIPERTGDADTSLTVDLTGVPSGMHQVYFRARNNRGTWGIPYRMLFLNEGSTPHDPSPKIAAAEYYIDTDPGYGLGQAFPVPADSLGDTVFTAALDAVSSGMHVLYARVRDAGGAWSLSCSRPFTNEGSLPSDPQPLVTGGEYFVDTDPGIGGGTAFGVAADSLVDTTLTADLGTVTSGLHLLYYRMRDANGGWSLGYSHPFLNMGTGPQDPAAAVAALEYFIDSDPGYGRGTAVTVTADSLIDLSRSLVLDTVAAGIHTLYLRAQDETGTWSGMHAYRFLLEDGPATALITNLEYTFIKSGTVMGSGTVAIDSVASDIVTHFRASMCGLQMDSTYELHVTAVDADGRRSLTATADSVTLASDGPPVFVDVSPGTVYVAEDFDGFGIDLDTVFLTSLCQSPDSLTFTFTILESLALPDSGADSTAPLVGKTGAQTADVFRTDILTWQQDSSRITFAAVADSFGMAAFIATAANDTGFSAADTFFIMVQPVNDIPVITSPAADTARNMVRYRYLVTSTDADPHDPRLVSYGPLPGWLQAAGDSLTGIPAAADTDTVFTVYVSDSLTTDSLTVKLAVRPNDDSLAITSYSRVKAYENEPFTYIATYTGTDTVVTVTWQHVAGWLSVSGDTLSGTPSPGTDDTTFTIIATAGVLADTQICTLLVDTVPQVVTVDPSFDPDSTDTLADSVRFVAISYLSVSAVQFTIDVASLIDTSLQGVALEYKMTLRDSFDAAAWQPIGFSDTSLIYTYLEPGDYKFALLLLGVVHDSTVDSILFSIRSKEYPLVDNWDLLSVPHNVLDRSVAQLLGPSIDVYRWDESADMDRYYLKYRKQSNLLRGASYWVRGDTSDTIDIRTVDYYRDDTVTVALQRGWNQISNPFSYGINWQDLLVRDSAGTPAETVGTGQDLVEKTIWLYTGSGYRPDSTLFLPWEGYFVYADRSGELVMQSPEPYFRGAAKHRTVPKTAAAGWRLRLSAASGRHTDTYNSIGEEPDALAGRDGYDLTEPAPQLGDHITLSLADQHGGNALAADIRKYGDDNTWACSVTGSRGGEDVCLSWRPDDIPGPYLYLVDITNGAVTDMKTTDEYIYTGTKESAEFIITPRMDETALYLYRNRIYITSAPNPGTGAVSLWYRFPVGQLGSAAATITIYDHTGTPVRTIPVPEMSAEPRRITLPSGYLSPGIYYYELVSSSGWSAAGRMTRVR